MQYRSSSIPSIPARRIYQNIPKANDSARPTLIDPVAKVRSSIATAAGPSRGGSRER